jgi:hypothetical protein
MSYFNHAFSKRFLGTGPTLSGGPITSDLGFVTTNGITSAQLSQLPPGYFAFFNPKTWVRVDAPANCCPLILASSSLLSKDKISPFLGGYKETNKSKLINPKYVHKYYRVDPCTPQQAIISIGNTTYTADGIASLNPVVPGTATYVNGSYVVALGTLTGTGSGAIATVTVAGGVVTNVVITSPGGGYAIADQVDVTVGIPIATAGTPTTSNVLTLGITDPKCCFEFLCGETYYLRIDIKGSPALRALNHNAYQNIYAYTGCCAGPTPTPVDSTLVMIAWAQMVVENNYLNPFLFPVVYDETNVAWFPPNSTIDPQGNPILPTQWWSNYVSPGHTPGACAGLRLFGAYVDTKFGDCSFQITDFFEKEPIKIYASLVDLNGDPCVFEGICVYNECLGVQGMGFGEQVLRDIILSESYLQNFFHTDIRIREITQGNDLLAAVNRNFLYTRYYILHTVPRYNNPTGVFDNDQYMLEVITTAPIPSFETYMNTWLGTCPDCVAFEVDSCVPCVITPAQP